MKNYDLVQLTIYGKLDQVPKELLTLETLVARDAGGSTLLHYIAYYGHLDQVPKLLLTSETMLVKDNNGLTPLMYATRNGHLNQLLGIDFGVSEEFKATTGEAWWTENKAELHQKKVLELGAEAHEVDL